MCLISHLLQCPCAKSISEVRDAWKTTDVSSTSPLIFTGSEKVHIFTKWSNTWLWIVRFCSNFFTEFDHITPHLQPFKVRGQRSRSQCDNFGENMLNHQWLCHGLFDFSQIWYCSISVKFGNLGSWIKWRCQNFDTEAQK